MKRKVWYGIAAFLAGGARLSGCLLVRNSAAKTTLSPLAQTRAFASFDVSPDGQGIVFVGYGQGGSDLYLLDLPTRRVSRLTASPEQELYPRFAPDGKQIVFSSGLPNFDANGFLFERHIYTRNLASGKTSQVTTDKKSYDYAAAFSADGRRLVFDGATPKTRNSYLSDIFVAEISTGVCRRLTHEGYSSVPRPRFWREDNEILFTAYKSAEDAKGMYLASVSVKNPQTPTPITPQPATTSQGQPLPGGAILLISDVVHDLNYKVCIFHPDTKKYDVLAASDYGPMNPVAAGNRVYWLEGNDELHCIDLVTRKKSLIADGSLFSDPMRWNGGR